MTADDRCPKCKSTDLCYTGDTEKDYVECDACGHEGDESEFWPTREELGLPEAYCAACKRRRSWGCGHTYQQELDAIAHESTTAHLLGDCDCFVSRVGYAARYTRAQRRDNVARVLRLIEEAATTHDWPGPKSDWTPEKRSHVKGYIGFLYDELFRDTDTEAIREETEPHP